MGDPACHLSATCIECGRFIDGDLEGDECPHCGAQLNRSSNLGVGRPLASPLSRHLRFDTIPL